MVEEIIIFIILYHVLINWYLLTDVVNRGYGLGIVLVQYKHRHVKTHLMIYSSIL